MYELVDKTIITKCYKLGTYCGDGLILILCTQCEFNTHTAESCCLSLFIVLWRNQLSTSASCPQGIGLNPNQNKLFYI